ncbi:MAG: ATP-binding protein [Terriglobia bacterium]
MTQSLLVLVAFCLLVGWAFNKGFAQYTNEFNDRPAMDFARALEAEYDRTGGWAALLHDPARWAALAMQASGHHVHNPTELPALFAEFKSDDFPAALGGAPLPLRFVLFDDSHHVLIGFPPRSATFREWNIRDEHGVVVGILGVPQNRPSRYDQQFRSRFLAGLGFMIAGTVLLAMFPALLIARLVTRPVNDIGRAARTLATGGVPAPLRVESSDELGNLAKDFNGLAIALERNKYLQRQWLAEISHELRTPVANLMAEAEAVMDGVRSPSRECFESLYEESRRLSHLIADLQQLSLMDGGMIKLQTAEINIGALLAECVRASQARFNLRGIEIATTVSRPTVTHVIGDHDKLQEVFMNLLENSLRYTDDGGKVRIAAAAESNQVRICYEDSSPGVSEHELPHLFRRLYRGDSSRSRASGGAGLGLAIVQSIIGAHGGEILVAQSPLGGLRFDITLKGGGADGQQADPDRGG